LGWRLLLEGEVVGIRIVYFSSCWIVAVEVMLADWVVDVGDDVLGGVLLAALG